MSIKVTVDTSGLIARAEQAAQQAARAVLAELNNEFDASFNAKAWDWPYDLPTRKLKGATLQEKIESYTGKRKKKNKEGDSEDSSNADNQTDESKSDNKGEGIKAGSPRNIIDHGTLRQSGRMEFIGPYSAKYTWAANYATAVHEGARIFPWGNKNRRVTLPARPWTSAVLGRVLVPGIEPYPMGDRLRDVWAVKFRLGR